MCLEEATYLFGFFFYRVSSITNLIQGIGVSLEQARHYHHHLIKK